MSETPTVPAPSGPPKHKPARPGYLVVALIVAWFLGLGTLQEGYVIARIIGNPLVGDTLSIPDGLREALVDSVGRYASSALPTAIAQMLLGGALLVVTAATFFGARFPVNFTLQILAANAALAVVVYFVSEPLREGLIGALATSPEFQQPPFNEVDQAQIGVIYHWGYRLKLLLHVVALGLAALALTRPAVRQFLAHSAELRKEN